MFESLISTLRNAALNLAVSVGASLALGFSAIVAGFLSDEREVLLSVKKKFIEAYDALKASGSDEINAIEGAATAAYNEFCHDEAEVLVKEADAVITLLASSLKSAAGLK